jgi:hypothetical protein
MPRKKSPDPKEVTMSARFTSAEAEQIDAARGSADRSPWLRQVALAATQPPGLPPVQTQTRGQRVKSGPPPGKPVPVHFPQPACDPRLPVGAYCKTCERTKT